MDRKEEEMTPEAMLERAIKNPDLEVIIGSRLYGTSRPDSDLDLRGFCAMPSAYLMGLRRFELKEETDPDRVIWAASVFFKHLLKPNTQCLEMLWAPEEFITRCSPAGRLLLENREIFLSKNSFRVFSGFACSEMRKVRGTKLVVEKRKHTEQEIIDQIRNVFHPPKMDMDEVIRILEQYKSKKEIPFVGRIGAKRKADIEKFGYSTSNAVHAIRLLGEGIICISLYCSRI